MALEERYSRGMILLGLLCCALAAAADDASVELVDPTRPVAFVGTAKQTEKTEKKLQLQAVFIGGDRREAVINGHRVREGEMVDQARILAIGQGRVSYARNGEKGELVLLPQVLQPVQREGGT